MTFQRNFYCFLPGRIIISRFRPSFNRFFSQGIIYLALKETTIHHRPLIKILPRIWRSYDCLYLTIFISHNQLCQQRLTVTKEIPVFSGISCSSAPPSFGQNCSNGILPFRNQFCHIVHLIQMRFIILCHTRIKIVLSHTLSVEIYFINTPGSHIQTRLTNLMGGSHKLRTQHRHSVTAGILYIALLCAIQQFSIQGDRSYSGNCEYPF